MVNRYCRVDAQNKITNMWDKIKAQRVSDFFRSFFQEDMPERMGDATKNVIVKKGVNIGAATSALIPGSGYIVYGSADGPDKE